MIDAVGNPGFGIDDALTAADLAFLYLAHARNLMNEAARADLEQARVLINVDTPQRARKHRPRLGRETATSSLCLAAS